MNEKSFHIYLAGGLVTVAFTFFFALLFIVPPDANRDTINMFCGFLSGTALTTVITYFFGSSSGSKKKDEVKKLEDEKIV